ncbi:hypothetical protein [Oceanirhabdus sp. W0125-5]|nr:hypothetical protein [Oceanirhabdus sp. W0125-5]WBW97101.1 hypothetical protein OW730_25935 [Oceanirhabdus sp. W0125-5]
MDKIQMSRDQVSRLQSKVDTNPNASEAEKEALKKAQSKADKSFWKNIK